MRATYQRELAGPPTAAQTAAAAQSLAYWRSNSLGYEQRVADGFYEVHGEFPEAGPPGEFPRLAALLEVRRPAGMGVLGAQGWQ